MSDNQRILVAMGEPLNVGDPPTVLLGLTDDVWTGLAGDKSMDIDLRKLGIAAVLLVMRGKDHEDIKRQLCEAAGALEIPTQGLADLSVPTPEKN